MIHIKFFGILWQKQKSSFCQKTSANSNKKKMNKHFFLVYFAVPAGYKMKILKKKKR